MGAKLNFEPKLFLTYNNQTTLDGVGAQLQRIISVFSISKLAHLGYLHSPLSDIDPQVYSSSDFEERLPEIEIWNNLFRDNLEKFYPQVGDCVFESANISLIQLRLLRFLSRFLQFRIICKLSNPRNITDKYPESLKIASELMNDSLWDNATQTGVETLTIVVHIRQGELALTQFKDRLLPLAHYEKILKCIVNVLRQKGIEFNIEIPRENGQGSSLSLHDPKVARSIELDPDNVNLQICDDGSVKLIHEIANPESTPILYRAHWLDESTTYSDFVRMIRADVLVTSKSSFSFVAGLLNNKSIKIFTPFWHNAPSDWISVNNLNEEVFRKVLSERFSGSKNR